MTLFDLSSLLSYVHADAPAEDMPEVDEVVVEEEEAEEEEPEDHMPQVVEGKLGS